jgi:MFS family permease
LAAALSGWLAAEVAARDVLVLGAAVIATTALITSLAFVRDTAGHLTLEQAGDPGAQSDESAPSLPAAFAAASYRRPGLRACSQAGLVNNLNDGLAWGLIPLFLAAHGARVSQIGLIAGLYPAVWGLGQVATGYWSDRIGRKSLIVAGMLLQAAALALLACSAGGLGPAAAAAVALGAGTALVYPTLIAAISDQVSPIARAGTIGVYRFWRDMGYVAGGLIAGLAADALGYSGAITIVAALTATSALWVAIDLPNQRARSSPPSVAPLQRTA